MSGQAARKFELQLMPPLCTYLLEGWEYSKAHRGGGARGSAGADLEAWDWSTAAIYTCSQVTSLASYSHHTLEVLTL
jgi:hypothetical protein